MHLSDDLISPLYDHFENEETAKLMPVPPKLDDEYREIAWSIPRYGQKF